MWRRRAETRQVIGAMTGFCRDNVEHAAAVESGHKWKVGAGEKTSHGKPPGQLTTAQSAPNGPGAGRAPTPGVSTFDGAAGRAACRGQGAALPYGVTNYCRGVIAPGVLGMVPSMPMGSPETTSSTRRFCCRPAAVSLEATGPLLPNPIAVTDGLDTPWATR